MKAAGRLSGNYIDGKRGMTMTSKFKAQYLLMQCLYWISASIIYGYSAVFLQYKGLSNTAIGIAAGTASFALLFVQPIMDNLIQKIRFLTPKRMMVILMIISNVLYFTMGTFAIPTAGLIVLFILTNSLYSCGMSFTTTIGMDYINQGHKLNFLFARGMGSFSYAICAFFMGQFIERYHAGILPYAFAVSQILVCVVLLFMKDTHVKNSVREEEESSGFLMILKENPVIRMFALAFTLSFMANTIVTTYMVNVVYQAGGTEASFGICCFMNAVSEFPAMLLCNYLIKKYSCRTLLKISSFFFIVKMAVLLVASSLAAVYFGYLLQSVSWGAFLAISVFLVNTELEPKDRLKGQSIFASLVLAAGGCIGNLIGGYVQDTWGLRVTIAVCLVIAIAGFLCCMSVKSIRNDKRKPAM